MGKFIYLDSIIVIMTLYDRSAGPLVIKKVMYSTICRKIWKEKDKSNKFLLQSYNSPLAKNRLYVWTLSDSLLSFFTVA